MFNSKLYEVNCETKFKITITIKITIKNYQCERKMQTEKNVGVEAVKNLDWEVLNVNALPLVANA